MYFRKNVLTLGVALCFGLLRFCSVMHSSSRLEYFCCIRGNQTLVDFRSDPAQYTHKLNCARTSDILLNYLFCVNTLKRFRCIRHLSSFFSGVHFWFICHLCGLHLWCCPQLYHISSIQEVETYSCNINDSLNHFSFLFQGKYPC